MIQWFTRDWGLKLISLLLAVGLWSYAMSEEGIEVQRTIPLKIEIKNKHMSILNTSVSSVRVILVASRALLSDLTSQEIIAVHEVGEEIKTAGEYSFRLQPGEIRLPKPQIRVARIEPDLITVTLDELIVQKLPVKANYASDPAFGYKVVDDEIQLDPNAIMVEGPKGQLEKIDSIATERIDLVGRIRSFRRTLSVLFPENVKPLTEALIDAYIPIREEFEEKSFDNVPVKVLRGPGQDISVVLEPAALNFVVKGSKRLLDKLNKENILTYMDMTTLSEGTHEVPVTVVLPEDVSIKDSHPIVKVTIKKK